MIDIKNNIRFCYIFLLVSSCLLGQKSKIFKQEKITKNINTGSNLTPNILFLDKDGFLWYTTHNGLVKKGSNSSILYPMIPQNTSSSDSFNKILKENKEIVWVATNRGVYRLNVKTGDKKWLPLKHPENHTIVNVLDLYADDEKLYITSNHNYLYVYNKLSQKIKSYKIPVKDKNKIDFTILGANEKKLIIFCAQSNFYTLTHNKISEFDLGIKNIKQHSTFKLIENGLLFPKNTSGEYIFNNKKYAYKYIPDFDKQVIILPDKSFSLFNWKNDILLEDSFSFLSIDTQKTNVLHFYTFNPKTKSLNKSNTTLVFKTPIVDVSVSEESIVYISTQLDIYKVKKEQFYFNTYLENKNTSNNSSFVIRSFIKNKPHNILIATHNGLYSIDEQKNRIYNVNLLPKSLEDQSDKLYRSLIKPNDTTLLIAGENNQIKWVNLNTNKFKTYHYKRHPKANDLDLHHIIKLTNETYLLATNFGIHTFNIKDKSFNNISQLATTVNLNNTVVRDVFLDSLSRLWVATDGRGLFVKDLKKDSIYTFNSNSTTNKLSSNTIYSLHYSTHKKMYVGTDKGVDIVANNLNKVESVKNDFLKKNKVVGILENPNSIWYSTYNGLYSFSKKNKTFMTYHLEDGLPSNEFNQRSFYKASDTSFYFGGINGFINFNPKKISATIKEKTIEIGSIEYFNSDKNVRENKIFNIQESLNDLEIPFNQNYINISVLISDIFNEEKLEVYYKIDGIHNDWNSNGKSNTIRLLGLSPGEYMLRIRADIGTSLLVGAKEITIPLKINQVFYKTTSFISLLVALALIALFIILRVRKKRIENLYNSKLQVSILESKALRAQMNPHFVYNVINGLQSVIFLKDELEINKYINAFSALIRMSLEMSHSDEITLQDELNFLKAYIALQNIRYTKKINLAVQVTPASVDESTITIPGMLIQPIVENAIIHGLFPKKLDDKKLVLKFNISKNYLNCLIIDNGIGRKASLKLKKKNINTHKSLATKILSDRISNINNIKKNKIVFKIVDLYDENKNAAGTKVIINIPL